MDRQLIDILSLTWVRLFGQTANGNDPSTSATNTGNDAQMLFDWCRSKELQTCNRPEFQTAQDRQKQELEVAQNTLSFSLIRTEDITGRDVSRCAGVKAQEA